MDSETPSSLFTDTVIDTTDAVSDTTDTLGDNGWTHYGYFLDSFITYLDEHPDTKDLIDELAAQIDVAKEDSTSSGPLETALMT